MIRNKVKNIWMCWFQGEDSDSIQPLHVECIKRWRDLNPDWEVNVLTNETIPKWAPEYNNIVESSPERTYQAKSDLLRLLLLSKYGGVWVDATLYPAKPLSSFFDRIVNHTGFFSYRFIPRGSYTPGESLEIPSWFLCVDRPNHYLIDAWQYDFINRFKTNTEWPYKTVHMSITDLYDTDTKIRNIIDNMVQISEAIPHSACQVLKNDWENRQASYVYKKPKLEQILESDEIPDGFNSAIYKSLHEDLAHMDDKEAQEHYLKYGKKEGRAYRRS